MKPYDISLTPPTSGGRSSLLSARCVTGRLSSGSATSDGSDGPCTSASRRPTRPPSSASAKARPAATVDFPTPPLQLDTPISAPTRCSDTGALWPMKDRGSLTAEETTQSVAQSWPTSRSRADASIEERCGHAPEWNSRAHSIAPFGRTATVLTVTSSGASAGEARSAVRASDSNEARCRGESVAQPRAAGRRSAGAMRRARRMRTELPTHRARRGTPRLSRVRKSGTEEATPGGWPC